MRTRPSLDALSGTIKLRVRIAEREAISLDERVFAAKRLATKG